MRRIYQLRFNYRPRYVPNNVKKLLRTSLKIIDKKDHENNLLALSLLFSPLIAPSLFIFTSLFIVNGLYLNYVNNCYCDEDYLCDICALKMIDDQEWRENQY